MTSPTPSPLHLLLDFDRQDQRDRRQTPDFLHRRDRRLALGRSDALPITVADWLNAVDAARADAHAPDPRLRTWRRLRLGFLVGGALLGALAMTGLLYVDGQGRVNVTLILALALLQLVLALATTAQALAGWRPWGRWLGGEDDGPLGRLAPQLAARVAHTAGLAFAATALLTLLAQILVRDLAFGWSTTLQTPAPAYQALMDAIAWPWRGLLPAAVPDLALVSESRYFRLRQGTVEPAMLGAWWPFLVLTWVCYVVLPRALLLLGANLHLRLRARRLLKTHPGYRALQQRLRTPWVETSEAVRPAPEPAAGDHRPLSAPPDTDTLIRWAGAALPDAHRPDTGLVLDAGGSASLEQDRDTLARADRGEPVLVVTRAWEPPTGELADFLDDARARLPGGTLIALLPVAGDNASEAPLAQWRRFVERRNDPHLRLCQTPASDPGAEP